MPESNRKQEILDLAYRAFNARDVEAAVALMHPDVDWANAWEGGRVSGPEGVRDYWTRQFAEISAELVPEEFSEEADGRVTVTAHQLVRDTDTGDPVSSSRVQHQYRFEGDLIVRMDVLD